MNQELESEKRQLALRAQELSTREALTEFELKKLNEEKRQAYWCTACSRRGEYSNESDVSFFRKVVKIREEGRLSELLKKPELSVKCPEADVITCLHIESLCIARDTIFRPTMTDVVLMLTSDVALQFKVDVKVYLEGPIMVVKGVREMDRDFEDDKDECNPKIYSSKLSLDAGLHTYKIEGIKAVLTSGVLKVKIPKVKHEE